MAQIRREQAKAIRTPLAPDVDALKFFDKKRQEGLDIIEANTDFFLKKQVKEEQSIIDLTESKATQVYKNAATLYPADPVKYSEFVAKNIDTIWDSIPDSDAKTTAQAKVSIIASGYNARVQKNASGPE